MHKKVSVITSTKNREDSLKETIETFFSVVQYPSEYIEYIIVNDGDNAIDHLFSDIIRKKIKIVPNKGKGLAAGRNTGANMATGDIILFLDDDILITPQHLTHHVNTITNLHPCLVTAHREYPLSMVKEMRKTSFGRYKEEMDYIWHAGNDIIREIDNRYIQLAGLAGFSCSMTRECFKTVGQFNENFPAVGNEDLDFYWRASALGYKLIYDKDNLCYHNEFFNLNLETWLERQENGMTSFLVLSDLYPEEKKKIIYTEYTGLKVSDNLKTTLKKIIKNIFSFNLTYKFLHGMILLLDASKVPQPVMNKFYNFIFTVRCQIAANKYHSLK